MDFCRPGVGIGAMHERHMSQTNGGGLTARQRMAAGQSTSRQMNDWTPGPDAQMMPAPAPPEATAQYDRRQLELLCPHRPYTTYSARSAR